MHSQSKQVFSTLTKEEALPAEKALPTEKCVSRQSHESCVRLSDEEDISTDESFQVAA